MRLFFTALVLFASQALAADSKKPIVVFILAGQSNMEGKAKVELPNTR